MQPRPRPVWLHIASGIIVIAALFAWTDLQAGEAATAISPRSGVVWLVDLGTVPANDVQGTIPPEDFADLQALGGLFIVEAQAASTCRIHLQLAGESHTFLLTTEKTRFAFAQDAYMAAAPRWALRSAVCQLSTFSLVLLAGPAAAYADENIDIYWHSLVEAETFTQHDTTVVAASMARELPTHRPNAQALP